MELATLEAAFPWGLLVASDESSDLQVPDFRSPDDQISASDTATAIRVLHEQEGEVRVRILPESADPNTFGLEHYASAPIRLPTGQLVVGDVERHVRATIDLPPGKYELHAYADRRVEATRIDLMFVARS